MAAALLLAACAPQSRGLPNAPVPAGPAIRVAAEPVGEMADGAAPRAANNFAYAGGLVLGSPDTSRFHGLSDLEVAADGRLVAVTDAGDLVKGRLVLDSEDRLAGVSDVTLEPLLDPQGRPISGRKSDSDAEGLAIWPNGDLLVSFEHNHRIWLYPATGGPPRAVPSPQAAFPDNGGMEALALDPASGPDAYLAGREDNRDTWVCRLSGGCLPGPRVQGDGAGALVAARALPGGRWAFLLRDYAPLVGNTIWLVIADRNGRALDTHEIRKPATVDNFEALGALPRPDGTVRFYLLSDDNFSTGQRTLLMAFDWTPPATTDR